MPLERFKIVPVSNGQNLTYDWSTGEETSSITIETEGDYALELTNEWNCKTTDEVVYKDYCPWTFYVPNTFTPNMDGLNDVFEVKGSNVIDYEIFIFNRWGDIIYTAQSMNDHWDGTANGNDVQIDVYVYKIIYSFESLKGLESKQRVGTVSLIR